MSLVRRFVTATFILAFVALRLPVTAQQVIATVSLQNSPTVIATNTVTNKIYTICGNTVTVIDGATYSTTSVPLAGYAYAIAVNQVSNKIYTANSYNNNVTVIDGATNSTTTVAVGNWPNAIDINPVTNKIYVANLYSRSVTVINGATNTTTTVSVGTNPAAVAVNSVTNKIYVANSADGTVTVIDGNTNSTSTVDLGNQQATPVAIAIDFATNQIYVCDQFISSVTVIDGSTLSTETVATDFAPIAIAVNSVTNKIYAASQFSNSVTAIDGQTLSTTIIPVEPWPAALAVDSVRNRIYVANSAEDLELGTATVSVINGATNATMTIAAGTYGAVGIAADLTTNRIYVSNESDQVVSVIDGTPPTAAQFIALPAPCRLADTRLTGSPIQGGTSQSFPVPQLSCDIPANSSAYSLNVTAVPHGSLGFLSVYPTGAQLPQFSTLNSWDGRVKANAAIVPAGQQGAVSVYASNTTDVVLDINGYFQPPGDSTLVFYPLPPCRVADTRWQDGDLGGPYLEAQHQRDLPVLQSHCGIPGTAQAYSLNFTVIPRNDQVWVFNAWPAGQSLPGTSTLNAPTGTVVANAAIVPAGAGGDLDVWASSDTDLAVDVNGYFAPPGEGGLSLYPVAPCRALDTRILFDGRPFEGLLSPPVKLGGYKCEVYNDAQAIALNATLVPAAGPVWLLTLWPDGGDLPHVSTLNAYDGAVASNMAIVPTTNGSINVYAAGLTQLILDITGYFAP